MFAVTRRTVFFEGKFSDYDVYPDGQRLVINRPADPSRDIVVIVNWMEDVKRRMRTGN